MNNDSVVVGISQFILAIMLAIVLSMSTMIIAQSLVSLYIAPISTVEQSAKMSARARDLRLREKELLHELSISYTAKKKNELDTIKKGIDKLYKQWAMIDEPIAQVKTYRGLLFFVVCATIGLLSLVIGYYYVSLNFLSMGLTLGGVLCLANGIFKGYVVYWGLIPMILGVLVLLAALWFVVAGSIAKANL